MFAFRSYSNVKRAEKVEAASDYTPEMEAQFIKLAGYR